MNISTATVNRALSGKGRVSEKTKARVFEKANQMGFKPNFLARSLARRAVRIAVVAFTSFPEFHNDFVRGASEAYSELYDHNVQADFFHYDKGSSNTPEALEFLDGLLEYIAYQQYDGALVCARQSKSFDLLGKMGVMVATIVNDIEQDKRRFCVRYNGRTAGRTAAELIFRMGNRNKPVLIASGGDEQRGIHAEIVAGFMEQLAFTPLKVEAISYHYDDEGLAYVETLKWLQQSPGLGAIYVNSFNSKPILRAVCEAGRVGDLCIITSDVYQDLKPFIIDGTVSATIFQDQYQQGKLGFRLLYQSIADDLSVCDTTLISPQIVMASNLDLY